MCTHTCICVYVNVRASQTITTLNTTLDERDTELFTAISEGKGYVAVDTLLRHKVFQGNDHVTQGNNRYFNKQQKEEYQKKNIENWRSKGTLKRKAVAATPIASPPAQKRQKLHECGKCEGCRDTTRAECAVEHGLKVWE